MANRQSDRNADDGVLPLTNIVFLLLIFFMIAGRLTTAAPFDIVPPVSASDAPSEMETVLIWIEADGRIALDGAGLAMAEFPAALAVRLADQPDVPAQLRADGEVAASYAVAVIGVVRDAGVTELTLLTRTDP